MNTAQIYEKALHNLIDAMARLYVATIDHMKVSPPSNMKEGGERRWALRNMTESALVQTFTAANVHGLAQIETCEIIVEAMNGAMAIVHEVNVASKGSGGSAS